jgi:squalene cyclase
VREMSEVTTMWALLALQPYDADPSVSGATRRAGEFLATAQPGKSTEWHAVRLLLQPDLESLREAVLKLQHADGGWGWLAGEPGDALGTGLALYALASSGLPAAHDAAQRAIGFLKRTQKPDGSWAVPSTRARDKNKVIPTATYWGTAWATIALLELSQAPAR